MSPYYLDRDWRYHTAASHANAGAFARRQQQRRATAVGAEESLKALFFDRDAARERGRTCHRERRGAPRRP